MNPLLRLPQPATVQFCGNDASGERRLDRGQAVLTRGGGRRRERAAARDDVDRAAERVGAVDRGRGAVDHFDPIDRTDGHRDLAVVMAALAVVQAEPVHEHETLTERRAAHREVRLHVARPTRARVESGDQPQTFDDGRDADSLEVLASQDGRRARRRTVELRDGRRHEDVLGNLGKRGAGAGVCAAATSCIAITSATAAATSRGTESHR